MSVIVFAVQLIGILIPVAGIFVLAFKEQSRATLYLMLTNVGCLILNCGHMLVLSSESFDAARVALNMEYLGNVMFYLSFALFIMTYLNLRRFRLILIWWAVQDAAALFFLWSGINEQFVYQSIRFTKTSLGVSILLTEIGNLQVARYGLICTVLAIMLIYTLFRVFRIANKRERTNYGKLAGAQFIIVATLSLNVSAIATYDVAPLFSSFAILAIILGVIHGEFFSVIDQGKSWLVENMPSAFIIADKDYGYQDANAYAKRLFPKLQMLRKARRLPAEIIDLMESGEDHLQLDGEYYEKTVQRIRQKDEEMGVALLLLNTTEDHRLIEQVQEARNRADEANKAKSSFLANMSHEIRTPINAILGMDEMILRESGEAEILSYAADIQSAGKTLLSLINDILDFSKVEEGKMEILPTQYELGSIINDLVNMSRPRAEKKGLRLEVRVDEKTPHLLYGDEIRIRQCALNILTNAVKYTETGSVTLDVGYDLIDDERISLRFSVSDTGIGMKQEDMDKLYSPFERIEETRNRAVEGTGLGMSITKQLLVLMGSRLEVQSVYGEGSTFSFAVEQPVVKWDPIGSFADRYRTNEPRRAYRELFRAPDAHVLVVDDTPVNLSVIKGLLKRTQLTVDTALSGREALSAAAQTRYDVIFIDHMMPDMDGIETLRELRKLPNAADAPCVALTANAISGAREMYLEAGFSDYLAKPVDGGRLEKLLLEYLPPEKVREPAKHAPSGTNVISGPAKVLVVDDDAQVCRLAERILGKSFRVEACRSGAQAVQTAAQLRPDLILLDINLGDMTGFDVLRELRESPMTDAIPVVFLTGESDEAVEIEGFRSGATDFVRKPFVPEVLLQRTKRIITLYRLQCDLQSEVRRQTLRAGRLSREMMLALSKTVDAKDHYTNGHSERVAAYSAEIARRMGKSAQEQTHIYGMGLMHDIGKIGVPEEIINKTSRLTDEEFEKIKRHTVIGSEILHLITEMPELADGARSHHERYDGTGYPDGLKGAEIPEAARIICLADCYDAMTSTRTYSTPRAQSAVRAEIERCSGTQFDPEIAKILLAMIDEDTEYQMTERTADIRVWRGGDELWMNADAETQTTASAAEASDAVEEEPAVELPEWLRGIDGLDVDQGLRHCGTEETYLDTLTIYAKNAPGAADEIENYWRALDVGNTTVKVHALKSMSRAIGAEELGALAEKLELAGKAGDTQTLGAKLGELLTRFRALGTALAPLCAPEHSDDVSLPPITDDELRDAYDSLRELAANLDSESAAYVLKFLDEHRLPDGERERVEKLRRAIEGFDWEQVETILS